MITEKSLKRNNNIRTYYENVYYKDCKKQQDFRRISNNLRAFEIRQGDKIIDIGCGNGLSCAYLVKRGAKAFGIDISFKVLKVALQYDDINVVQANAEYLPFKGSAFDGAIFMGTLEHFIDPGKALNEVKRALKPKAKVAFAVPNSNFSLFRFLEGTGQIHEVPRTLNGWKRLFAQHGFEIGRVYKDIGPNICKGDILWGILRKIIILIFNLLPLRYTYQFVFICRNK